MKTITESRMNISTLVISLRFQGKSISRSKNPYTMETNR